MSLAARANNAASKVRAGFEDPCLTPANVADASSQAACLLSSDVVAANLAIDNAGISETAKDPFAGQQEGGGTVTWIAGPGELTPLVFNAFVRYAAIADLGGGAFRVRASREEANLVPDTYTYWQDEGDGLPLRFVGAATEQLGLALEDGAPQWTAGVLSTYATPWDAGAFFPLAGGSGRIELRGGPFESRLRGNEANRSSIQIRVVERSSTQVSFLTGQGTSQPFSGTWTITAATAVANGSGGAALTDCAIGDLLQVGGELLTVQSVDGNDQITFTTNHVAGATSVVLHRDYGYGKFTEPYGTIRNVGLDPFNGSSPVWNPTYHSLTGVPLGSDRGQPIQLHLSATTGIPASATGTLSGTHSVTAGSAAITGSGGTSYLSELPPGSKFTTAGGQVGRIKSVTDNSNAVADRNFTTTEAAVSADFVRPPLIAGAGTIDISGTTLTGTGTNFTAADIGSEIFITPSGQRAVIVSVTSPTVADVAYPLTAGLVQSYAFYVDARFDLGAAVWAQADHPGGTYLTKVHAANVFTVDPSAQQFELGCLQELALTLPGGRARKTGKGAFACSVEPSGSDQGAELTFTVARTDETWTLATLEAEKLQVRVLLETQQRIGTSSETYHEWLIFNGVLTNPTAAIPDATTNEISLTLALGANATAPGGLPEAPGEPAFTAAATRVLYTDVADPFATTP